MNGAHFSTKITLLTKSAQLSSGNKRLRDWDSVGNDAPVEVRPGKDGRCEVWVSLLSVRWLLRNPAGSGVGCRGRIPSSAHGEGGTRLRRVGVSAGGAAAARGEGGASRKGGWSDTHVQGVGRAHPWGLSLGRLCKLTTFRVPQGSKGQLGPWLRHWWRTPTLMLRARNRLTKGSTSPIWREGVSSSSSSFFLTLFRLC